MDELDVDALIMAAFVLLDDHYETAPGSPDGPFESAPLHRQLAEVIGWLPKGKGWRPSGYGAAREGSE